MRSRLIATGIIFAIFSVGAACIQRKTKARVSDVENGPEKARWLAKAARVLHYRKDLQDIPNYQELLNKSRSDAVDALMADPKFGNSVLDFGLYYMGFQPVSIFDYNGGYATGDFDAVGGVPQAIHAAQEVVRGGDFFKFFDRLQPQYMDAVTPVSKEGLPAGIGDVEARAERVKRSIEHFRRVLEILDKATTPEDCGAYQVEKEKFDLEIAVSGFNVLGFDSIDLIPLLGCFLPGGPIDFVAGKKAHEPVYAWLLELQQNGEDWLKQVAKASNVLEIQTKSLFKIPGPRQSEALSGKIYIVKTNSSTNFNRRRAAYILDRFFCDELTPLNVALPASHAGQGAHASEPACQACHFKLDPMAGFFKGIGIGGTDFTRFSMMIFDDQKRISGDDLTKYMNSWKETDPELAVRRPWRVGYVRSPDIRSAKNTWGESYDDLFKIIREAPEVKQCLTRRMAEYFVGNNLVYDGAWIRQLASRFENLQGAPSSVAFKSVVKELVLSKTFSNEHPSSDQCYDFPQGSAPSTLPCKVADIVQRNCVGCHSSSSGPGNLNLSQWTQTPSGAFSFEHFDDAGQRLPKKDSLGRILERLSSPDSDLLMPLNKFMPDVERATLYKFVNDELQSNR